MSNENIYNNINIALLVHFSTANRVMVVLIYLILVNKLFKLSLEDEKTLTSSFKINT
jgi:hypothetical protein